MKNYNCCVNCGKRTDKDKKLKERRQVSKGWMTNFFKAKNVVVSKYKWICLPCRVKITLLHKDNNLFKETKTISGLFSSLSLNPDSYFDKLPEKNFPHLTGLTKKEFFDLYKHISIKSLKSRVELVDALGLYLTKYYSGIILKNLFN